MAESSAIDAEGAGDELHGGDQLVGGNVFEDFDIFELLRSGSGRGTFVVGLELRASFVKNAPLRRRGYSAKLWRGEWKVIRGSPVNCAGIDCAGISGLCKSVCE